MLFKFGLLLPESDGADTTARDESSEVDAVILFMSYTSLENINEVFSNNSFYSFCKEWPELEKLRFQSYHLPLLSYTLLESINKALSVVQLRTPQILVIEMHEDGIL